MKGNRPGGLSRQVVDRFPDPDADIRETAVQVVCLGFCEYLKEEGGEDGCGGFTVAKRIMESGRIDLARLEQMADRKPGPARRSAFLMDHLCSGCGYVRDGCDYLSPLPPAGATPCGGYRFLQTLLECEALSEGDVESVVKGSS